MLGHHQVFQNRHAGKQADVLEGARHLGMPGDEIVIHAFQQELLAAGMAQLDHAFRRLVKTGDAVEHRGFARAIGADEGGDFLASGAERQLRNGGQATKTHGELLDVELRIVIPVAHQPCPSATRSPEIDFFSLRKTVGSRLVTKPRGRKRIISTMARPTASMRN